MNQISFRESIINKARELEPMSTDNSTRAGLLIAQAIADSSTEIEVTHKKIQNLSDVISSGSDSSDRNAKVLNQLTYALVFVGIAQILVALVNIFHK